MTFEKLTLKQWRNLKGMSQKELSQRSGVTERSIANYEKDIDNLRSAKYSTIINICNALDISVDNIFLESTSEKLK